VGARQAGGRVEITYIANEGALISSGDKQVLIDGLHREYKPDYMYPPPALLEKLEKADKPFDEVDIILVSHVHLDHFHPQSVGLHLKNNPRALLLSSDQVVASVANEFGEYRAISSRVKPISWRWKEKVVRRERGISITFLGLRHANKQFESVQNLGHIIELGGKKLLHIGDADMPVENFERFNLADERIEVAFIPYWYLLYPLGQSIVKEHIKPRHIIAVHISPAESAKVSEQIKRVFPEAIAFTDSLQIVRY
jgi:L-ascorbate metabolism protein UlaG (beta-lactamase superfamily)